MLLALSDRGSESPTPTSWPGRAPVALSVLDGASARAGVTLIASSAAVVK
jgi:hypothetical protein